MNHYSDINIVLEETDVPIPSLGSHFALYQEGERLSQNMKNYKPVNIF